MNTIGERIFDLMKKNGYNQRELANKIGATEAAMSRWIKNEREPRISVIAKLTTVLNTTADYLITGKELTDEESKILDLEQQVSEYEDLIDIMDNRKWRKKFNKEIWEKELGNKLSTPDFDFVYMLFFEQRKELKKLKELKGE